MDQALEQLIELKFSLEREISIMSDVSKKIIDGGTDLPIEYKNIINPVFVTYQINILAFGKQYLDKQISLLAEVNNILFKLCKHNWVHDTIEDAFSEKDICYCNKCFIKK